MSLKIKKSFQLGIDDIPDWFMSRVSSNKIILHGERNNLQCACIHTFSGILVAHRGDIITLYAGFLYVKMP